MDVISFLSLIGVLNIHRVKAIWGKEGVLRWVIEEFDD